MPPQPAVDINYGLLHRPRDWLRFPRYTFVEYERTMFVRAVPEGVDPYSDPKMWPDPSPVTTVEARYPTPLSLELPLEVLPRVLEVDLDDRESVLGFVNAFGLLDGTAYDELGIAVESTVSLFLNRARDLHAMSAMWDELCHPTFSAKRLARIWADLYPAPFNTDSPGSRQEVRDHLASMVEAGLRSVRVSLRANSDGEFVLGAGEPESLFALCCIELANNILNDRGYRHCANETCKRLFAIQEGRTEYGGHRSDAIYCSRSCANAQSQREWRRRNRKSSAGGRKP